VSRDPCMHVKLEDSSTSTILVLFQFPRIQDLYDRHLCLFKTKEADVISLNLTLSFCADMSKKKKKKRTRERMGWLL
jgi:hypothetical protein